MQIPFEQKMELLTSHRSAVCTAGSEDTECRRVAGLRKTEVLEARVMKGGGEVVLLITAAEDFVAPGNSRLTGRPHHSGRHSDGGRQNCSRNSQSAGLTTLQERSGSEKEAEEAKFEGRKWGGRRCSRSTV